MWCFTPHSSTSTMFHTLLAQDAEYLLQLEPPIEYICVSFVQKGQDLQELIDIMDRLKIPQDTRGLK